MKKSLASLLTALAALPASALVVQTTGAGNTTAPSTGSHLSYAADFEGNTGVSGDWLEGGLQFVEIIPATPNNAGNVGGTNGGCGYAGEFCADPANGVPFSAAFDGNFFMTSGYNAYLSIRSTGYDLHGIEFAVDSGFFNINLVWQTYRDGQQTGTGKAAMGFGGDGGVLGLSDLAGFDEVRLYAFDSPGDNPSTTVNPQPYSAPAIDSVRAFTIPEPGSLTLVTLAGLCAAGLRRRRG